MKEVFMKASKEIIVIAGCRMDDWSAKRKSNALDSLTQLITTVLTPDKHIIISGGARGIDSHAYNLAVANEFEAYELRAPWYLGKHGGHLRNDLMVRIGDSVYTLWDGESRGTGDTIQRSEARGNLRGTIRI